MSSLIGRLSGWLRRNLPTREQMEHNRFIRPFALRHELWRFTRRSVPRGVAVGLLVGIFALIPGVQIVGAVLLCVPSRGNIPLAAAMTFLSMPLTTPFILLAATWVGNMLGFHADIATVNRLMADGAGLREWGYWLLSDAAPALLTGLFVIAVISASLGYLIAAFGWRWWVGHKRAAKLVELRERGEVP